MEKQNIWRKLLNRLFGNVNKEERKAIKEVLPFFLLVTLVLIWLYILVLKTVPAVQDPILLAVFSALMAVHMLFYWFSIYFSMTRQRTFFYLLTQGILVMVIVVITRSDTVVMALFSALMGNAIGILGKQRASIFALAFYLVLGIISYTIIVSTTEVQEMLGLLVPVLGFTIFFAYFFNRQIEARARVQQLLEELEEAHRQLAEYTIQVEDLTLASERQRMARELHDTLAQGLAGLILQLEAAVIHIEAQNSAKARQIVEQAMSRARTTLVDARRAIDDLRTDLSSPEALLDILTREVERFTTTTGIPCEFDIHLPDTLNAQLSEHILRTLSEGLWNIARHARASQAEVSISSAESGIIIKIRDNGIGFDPQDKVARSGHYGLLGIRERARLAGGQLQIDSQTDIGTTLTVKLPVPQTEEQV